MAAAGFVPVIGWAGRVAKGGNAVYKTVKGINAADHALDAYKSTKAMDILKQTEAGIYGLAAANGFGEAATGKDMFGNTLTDEQRQNSLMNALGITTIAGAAKAVDKMASGSKLIPHSKEYVQNQVQKAQGSIKDMAKSIGKTEVPTGFKVREVADTTGTTHKMIDVDKTTIKDLAQKITAKGEGSKGAGKGSSGISEVKTFVDKGQHFTNGRKNRLKPNIRYNTGEYDYFYETDKAGRIVSFETENLQLTTREERLSHSRNTPGKVKGQDHAGHLAGDRFGGSPKVDNLVSQLSDVNLKEYKKIEDEWAAALKEIPPKEVTVDVEIIYTGSDMRPQKFIVNYLIDGKPGFKVIKN